MQQSHHQFKILSELQAIPLCIITAKQEEAELIQRYMNASMRISGNEVAFVDSQHTFWKGTIELKSAKEIEFYVTHCTRQAIQTFAVEATYLLGLLKPKYAIHAGVCASLDANIGVCHVVFGEMAANYDEGKWDAENQFHPDLKTYDSKCGFDGFLRKLGHGKYHRGDFISGSAVRMDIPSFADDRRKHLRRVKALDMEASAFIHICLHLNITSLGIIKGVSDQGDKKKGEREDEIYPRALEMTADAIQKWVQHYNPALHQTQQRKDEPGYILGAHFLTERISLLYDRNVLEPKDGSFDPGKIHALVIVQPDKLQHHFNGIADAVKRYNLQSVILGDHRTTFKTFYYLKGVDPLTLFDFVNTPTVLVKVPDSELQCKYFWDALGDDEDGRFVMRSVRLAQLQAEISGLLG